MRKILIPAILATTLLVATIFAFVPVHKATAVHSAIIATIQGADGIDNTELMAAITGIGFGLSDNSITASTIATDAIGADEIAAGAITASEAPSLDATVSSRATPADILTDPNIRIDAQKINNLDSRLTDARASNLDNLDAQSSAIKAKTDLIGNANPAGGHYSTFKRG